MGRSWSQGQRFLTTAIVIAVLVFSVLGFALYRVISNAAQTNVANQTAAASSSAAQTIAGTITNQVQLANAVVGEDGIGAYVQGEADRLTTSRVEYANTNIQRANPQVRGFYFYDSSGSFVFAQTADQTHQTRNQPSASCDTTNVYCVLANAPTVGYFSTQQFQKYLANMAGGTARPNAAPLEVFVFDANGGPYGSLYIFKSIPSSDNRSAIGTMVEEIDAGNIFASYLHAGNSGNLILAGPVVIGPDIAAYHARGQLPVLTTAGLDSARVNGLRPVRVGYDPTGASPAFTYNGTAVQGSSAPVTMSDLQVVNYAPSSALPTSSALAIFGSVLFFLVLIATIVALSFYLNRRVQRGEQESAMLMRAKSEALTEDIVAVSQALAVAREGDLTVQVPDSESEVGLLSLSLNGLISDYGQIVGGIIRASQAVQDGAARVDEGVRRIVDVATSQAESVALVATSVEDVATSAVEVQQATTIATDLASGARVAVQSGQDSVGRIGEAVDAIKEAAIGTTREFKRLQEDSIRLTALVASVKSNAENLDMQAANATLEARHLGTESGSAFATNIGRLARQAQDTLADAEGAVRSVVTSIDEVNRRIERISEQVRRGVEEVRTVRSTFDEITRTNGSLVQFIDSVADSAGIQAGSAQQAALSISEIATVFEQFTELLITSGDEIANMRLIVAGLRESVADLKVEDVGDPLGALLGTDPRLIGGYPSERVVNPRTGHGDAA